MCVSWGVCVTREHSAPERASPLRAARHGCPVPPAPDWCPAGASGLWGPQSWTLISFPLSWPRGGPCLRSRTQRPPCLFPDSDLWLGKGPCTHSAF